MIIEVGNISEARYVNGGADQEIQTYTYYGATHASHGKMNRLRKIEYDMDASGGMGNTVDYTVTLDYDANGNMTAKDINYVDPGVSDEEWDFSYDEDDRLITVLKDSSTVAEYSYDPFGRRIFKKVGNDKEVFFYDREDVIQEYDAVGSSVINRFLHGPGIDDYIAMVDQSSNTHFYNTDGLGSVTDMTAQATAAVNTRYEYEPFGKASVLAGYTSLSGINPYEYTGRRFDTETGLMYYRSRYYDPNQRRFVQEDRWRGIKSRPGTFINKYAYVGNNPVNYVDPFGNLYGLAFLAIGIFLGVAVISGTQYLIPCNLLILLMP